MEEQDLSILFLKENFPNCWKTFLSDKIKYNVQNLSQGVYYSFLESWNDYEFIKIFENRNIRISIIYNFDSLFEEKYSYEFFVYNKFGKILIMNFSSKEKFLTHKNTLIHLIISILNVLENDKELLWH